MKAKAIRTGLFCLAAVLSLAAFAASTDALLGSGLLEAAFGAPCKLGELTDEAYKKVPRVNGKPPRNGHWAGQTYPAEKLGPELAEKYPNGVRFNENGFPDFHDHAMDLPNGQKQVELDNLTGEYKPDARRANAEAGYTETPDDYTWHHMEDGRTMQLVPRDLHRKVGHTGGSAIIKGDYWTPCGD